VELEVVGVDEDLDASAGSELARDMLAIVASFPGRWYGQRPAQQRRVITCMRQVVG
jgi:predicted site-specific integrase-resolvase